MGTSFQAEHIETDLQGKYDVLSACVANLEAEDVKMKENLQSLKEIFDEINEKYLKEKSQLEQSRAVINEKHESTSVRKFSSMFYLISNSTSRQQRMILVANSSIFSHDPLI